MLLDADRVVEDTAMHEAAVPPSPPLVHASRVRLRHPMECLPARPRITPRWTPSRRFEASMASACEAATWSVPTISASPDLGSMRVNFVYASFQSMTAARSFKAKRDQYFEGSSETHGFRLHEVDPWFVDVLYQPIRGTWQDAAGRSHHLTLDFGVETADGGIVFGEDKATAEFHEEPETRRRLDHVEARLSQLGASLERRVAGGSPDRARRRIVKDVFDARRTDFDDSDVDAVRGLLARRAGVVPFGRVMEALGTHTGRARDMVFAMVVQRHLSIPFVAPVMPDTPVTLAPAAAKSGALKAFLQAHVPVDVERPA